jgi:curved DNA-binding protein CbpA
MEKDPYEVLGVPRDASDDEVEEAYRQRAKEYHPDVCDRDDATELFKRVKEAYETVASSRERGETDDGASDAGGAATEAEAATGAGTAETEEEATGHAGEGGTDGHDHVGGERVHESYGDGWYLGRDGDGWFVFSETETAPHVDETVLIYLDGDGTISSDRVRFVTDTEAREVYTEAYGDAGDTGSAEETREDRRGADRGRSDTDDPVGTAGATNTEDEVIWGGTRRSAHLDSLWRLCYQDGRTRDDGEEVRRWGVTTDVTGDERYINADGEYQDTGFWFRTEGDARDAYETYIRGMRRERSQDAGRATDASGSGGAPPSSHSGAGHARRHPLVQVGIEAVASAPTYLPSLSVAPYVSYAVRKSRSPVISFLHYVTFPRVAAFVKNSLKALVGAYSVLLIDLWGPRLTESVFGEGFVDYLTSGMFPLLIYLALIVLLLAPLLEDR